MLGTVIHTCTLVRHFLLTSYIHLSACYSILSNLLEHSLNSGAIYRHTRFRFILYFCDSIKSSVKVSTRRAQRTNIFSPIVKHVIWMTVCQLIVSAIEVEMPYHQMV